MMPDAPKPLDKLQVRRAFGRAATAYDQVAVVQRQMVDELIDRLAAIRCTPRLILDAGCGTGYGARRLRRLYPKATVLCLDLAAEMLFESRRRRGWFARERYVCGDIEALPLATDSVDLVFSSSALQWCDLQVAMSEFARVLRPQALLMFATFGPDTLRELREAWRRVDNQVHVHRFVDMHDIGDTLVSSGFDTPVVDVDFVQVTYRQVSQVMQELKQLGSANASPERRRGLTGRQRFKALQAALEMGRDDQGLFRCTYEVVYGHAWNPAQRLQRQADGTVAIPLAALRRR